MTKLLYLEDQNLYQTTATVTDFIEVEKGLALILDQTIFYVQGGGQPSDSGDIIGEFGRFFVQSTVKNELDQILHLGFLEGKIAVGANVLLEIATQKRVLNSKIHSAGHLIDLVVQNLGFSWIPSKGFHYPEGSYVQYDLNGDSPQDPDILKQKMNMEYNRLIQANLEIKIELDQTQQSHGQSLRTISFGDFPACACGGTHAANSSDLKGFEVTKLKVKSGLIKVSYGLKEECLKNY